MAARQRTSRLATCSSVRMRCDKRQEKRVVTKCVCTPGREVAAAVKPRKRQRSNCSLSSRRTGWTRTGLVEREAGRCELCRHLSLSHCISPRQEQQADTSHSHLSPVTTSSQTVVTCVLLCGGSWSQPERRCLCPHCAACCRAFCPLACSGIIAGGD
jgi:hypothetical protein